MDRNTTEVQMTLGQVEVALRKESVDRNIPAGTYKISAPCRSPQGERG